MARLIADELDKEDLVGRVSQELDEPGSSILKKYAREIGVDLDSDLGEDGDSEMDRIGGLEMELAKYAVTRFIKQGLGK